MTTAAPPLTDPQATAPPERITYEQFLERIDERQRAEWVDGEIRFMPPPSVLHQDLVTFLVALLRLFVEAKRLGMVLCAPTQIKLGPDLAGREPDILFVSAARAGIIKRGFIDGPADLAVEIVSPESLARDRGEKFAEYERAGVREYWIIDPDRRQADFYALGADKLYHPIPAGPDGVFRSAILEGLWLRIEWLWREPLPPLMGILKEWGLA